MRFYAAGNCYLSSIQQGIQAFHVLGEMTSIYANPEDSVWPMHSNYWDWLVSHKTLICLNGGNNASLTEFYNLVSDPRNTDLPYAKFNEDDQSMSGMLTSVGIIVPERIYDAVATEVDSEGNPVYVGLTEWESEFAQKLRRMSLAR